MSNVIREDVIKLGFDINMKELEELRKDVDELKKKLGILDDDNFEETRKSAQKAQQSVNKLSKAADSTYKALKKVAGISFKAFSVGVTAAAAGVGKIAYESAQAYGELEQLKGGVEKIFDQANISGIMKDANNAYETLGLSANDYLRTINDVGATFAATMGDQKGYDTAKLGLQSISDYASGTGKSVDLLSEKFTLITRSTSSYQSIADQFSGILPATSKDFLKQAKAAGFLSKKYTQLTQVPVAEYQSAVAKMLEKGVADLGLTGNTADEARKTVTGSLAMMQASWKNLLGSLGSGENLDQTFDNMIDSVEVFGRNIQPVIERSLLGIGTVVERLTPIIADRLPQLAEDLLPPLIRAAVSLTNGLIKALPSIIKTVVVTIVDIFGEQFPILRKIGDFFEKNSDTITNSIKAIIPAVVGLAIAFKGFKVASGLKAMFGGEAGGKGGRKGGIFGGITKSLKELAKVKNKVVLKGMANLSLILVGFVGLAAAFAWAAPYIAQLSDGKSLLKVGAIIIALGAIGMGLIKFLPIAGKIPISPALKGLANMALVLSGMTAIGAAFAWAAPYISNLSDTKSLLKVATIITVLGAIGTALTAFAGIAGMVPIPVVLTGLANMALVLGGLTAFIAAYGALGKIPGFNEFMSKGGDVLANLFKQLGKIVGAIIGGVGEGVTNSLPKIGENLSAFADSVSPMLSKFSGTDVSGVGEFLKALGNFVLLMTGEKVLSFITGKANYAALGTQLTDFANNASGFFTKIAEYPGDGFANATKLFDCLAGIKSLPKEGGVVGWFMGGINYENIANGLNQLASEKVSGFFQSVAKLPESGFSQATKLFDCLAGLKSLPKDGGVKGWFTGDIKYDQIASGLGHMSGEGVKNFFAMTAGLKQTSFDNATKLFECLVGMGNLTSGDDFWERMKDSMFGDNGSMLSQIAGDLGKFAEKAGPFFEQINSLKVGNLNGLWDSLDRANGLTANISKKIDGHINDIVKKISELPKKMGDGLRAGGESLSAALVDIWKDAVKASVSPVNKVLDAANWILKEFGSDKRVVSWKPYARGTNGHKGGNALVNDGSGAELVQMPNGNTFIPRGRNVFLPNAPRGMKVLPAGKTAKLMGRNSPTFRYANGTGNIDLWSYIDNSNGLVKQITNGIKYGGKGLGLHIAKSMVSTVTGPMSAWIDKVFNEMGAMSLAAYNSAKGVSQWKMAVIRALKMENQYSAANVKRTLYQMQTESGGNPKAINLWDSNAKKGIPSKGLMQVINPTFSAYARPGFDKNIYDPLSNILASIRYATSRYGSLSNAYRGVGYSNGVGTLKLASYTPEQDVSRRSSAPVENNTYSPQFTINISGTSDDRAMARKVKRWLAEAWEDMLNDYDSKAPKIQEV